MKPSPSKKPVRSFERDREFTERIRVGAELLGLVILDHIITGDGCGECEPYFSFKEEGLI